MAGQEQSGEEYELSPSGSPVYRHEKRSIPFQPAFGDSESIERISQHIEKHLGEVGWVYHELVSDLVHIDVHVVKPTARRPCYSLITSGMSEAPMSVPEEIADLRFAELMIQLPADWPLREPKEEQDAAPMAEGDERAIERWYWPIRWLKLMARLPHEYDTWLGAGHTVPNGDPAEPFADNTALCGMLVMPAINVPDKFATMEAGPQKTIYFHTLVPLHADEMDLKLRTGVEALIELLEKNQVDIVVDPNRPSVAPRRKWFGLF